MERAAARRVGDLLAAAEPVRHDQRIALSPAHSREERSLTDLHRHLVVLPLEAEGTRHATAAGVQDRAAEAQLLEKPGIRLGSHQRALVAMGVDEGLRLKP